MTLTIAIPFCNARPYLADAIRCVFAQTFTDWELILLDDGSTDGSLDVAKAVDDPRVRVVSDGRNLGLATRLNEVTRLADSDLIARMDADDLMSPRRLEVQYRVLSENPAINLVSTGLLSLGSDGELVGRRGIDGGTPSFDDVLYQRRGVLHGSVVARREWLSRNPYNERLRQAQDVDLWLSAIAKGDFSVRTLSEPLYVYREGQSVGAPKLLGAYRVERHDLSRRITSRRQRQLYIARSYAKSTVVWGLDKVGRVSVLQSRRNDTIAPEDQHLLDEILDAVRSTEVPGFGSGFASAL